MFKRRSPFPLAPSQVHPGELRLGTDGTTITHHPAAGPVIVVGHSSFATEQAEFAAAHHFPHVQLGTEDVAPNLPGVTYAQLGLGSGLSLDPLQLGAHAAVSAITATHFHTSRSLTDELIRPCRSLTDLQRRAETFNDPGGCAQAIAQVLQTLDLPTGAAPHLDFQFALQPLRTDITQLHVISTGIGRQDRYRAALSAAALLAWLPEGGSACLDISRCGVSGLQPDDWHTGREAGLAWITPSHASAELSLGGHWNEWSRASGAHLVEVNTVSSNDRWLYSQWLRGARPETFWQATQLREQTLQRPLIPSPPLKETPLSSRPRLLLSHRGHRELDL